MPAQEIQKFSKADERTAKELLACVNGLLDEARNGRESLERTYMDIAIVLDEVETSRAWMLVAHSFDAYIKSCEARFGKSRTQLYGYRSVAKNLLPAIPKEQLISIGISKAMPLAQYVKQKGGKAPENLISKAADPNVGVDEFRAEIAAATHVQPEKGKWFEFGGAFLTPAEREEIERGFARAAEVEPLPADISDWMKRKIVIQRLVAEFLSTYTTDAHE
jgi:hypothetical protein